MRKGSHWEGEVEGYWVDVYYTLKKVDECVRSYPVLLSVKVYDDGGVLSETQVSEDFTDKVISTIENEMELVQ